MGVGRMRIVASPHFQRIIARSRYPCNLSLRASASHTDIARLEGVMFCSKCSTELPDDSQFCRKCGVAISAVSSGGAATAVAPAREPVAAEKPKKSGSNKVVWFVIIVIALGAWWVASSNSPSARQIQQIAKQQHTERLNNPALSVNPTGFAYFKLDVPANASDVTLQGNFTASGGSGNDVEAYVMSEEDFVNWQNGHAAKTYYNSGKVTVGTINVHVPAGRCYLVFNNKFSLLSSKSVRVDGTLTYYQ